MKNFLKKISKVGLLATIKIGDMSVQFPGSARWGDLDEILVDGTDIVNMLVLLSSIVAVAMMIVSGYTLITSSGNPDKIEQGRKSLTGAVIGLVIVWVAGLIVKLVLETMKAS